MNLKNRPTKAKQISKALSKIKKLKEDEEVKEGVDLTKLARTLAKRNLKKVREEEEEEEEEEESLENEE